MKLKGFTDNIRKTISAAAGGLFLSALLWGCGYAGTGETIIIGAKEQKPKEAFDENRPVGLEHSELLQNAERQENSKQQLSEQMPDETLIRVYVCGAVISPCVAELPAGSRVEDALLEAGGFAPDAAVQAVNLADWIEDGQMLYFPTIEEAEEPKGPNAGAYRWNQELEPNYVGGFGQSPDAGQTAGLVNINTADAAALATMPGIGESRARDIISFREKNGDFASCEDIMKVSGIKTHVYEKIRDKITVK